MRVGARLRVPVAPSLVAWMQVLGQAPREADYGRLYSDGLHATLKGAYLNACSVYAAVTGESPVGLFYPEGLAAEEAREFQQAAWDAFRRTREEIAGGNATGNTSPR